MAEFLTGTNIVRPVGRSLPGDPVLVLVSGSKIRFLRRELGPDAENVSFADMAEAGANPGRIIAAWVAFVQANAGASQMWGIGEPVHSRRLPGRACRMPPA
jgi:hypothetical protein